MDDINDHALEKIMAYHVVPNHIYSSIDFKTNTKMETMAKDASGNAQSIVVHQLTNNLYINSAQLQQTDILLANGIMHIISNVLNPKEELAMPKPSLWSQQALFPESKVEMNPFTSAIPCTANCPVTVTPTTATPKPHRTEATPTSVHTTSSEGWAPARVTAHMAGAALGIMGAGIALM